MWAETVVTSSFSIAPFPHQRQIFTEGLQGRHALGRTLIYYYHYMYYRTMGKPHSIEEKRIKRWNQKRRKQHRLKQSTRSSGDEQNEGSTSCSSDQLTPEEELLSSPNDNEQGAEATDSGLFEALDGVCKESDDYWEKMTEEKIREFDSYRGRTPMLLFT